MIATAATAVVPEGAAVFHVNGMSQHAGLAGTKTSLCARMQIYEILGGRHPVRGWWGGAGDHYRATVAGWVSHSDLDPDVVAHEVLQAARHIADLQQGAPPSGESRLCCWRLRPPYRLLHDDETDIVVFEGSCSGFVEHCYEAAGVDLVDEGRSGARLPVTSFEPGEPEYASREYTRAGGTIRRLYPSYQIRAFQLEEYPWKADLAFRWYPVGFP